MRIDRWRRNEGRRGYRARGRCCQPRRRPNLVPAVQRSDLWLIRTQAVIGARCVLAVALSAVLLALAAVPGPLVPVLLASTVIALPPALAMGAPLAVALHVDLLSRNGELRALAAMGVRPVRVAALLLSPWLPFLPVLDRIEHEAAPAARHALADLARAGVLADPFGAALPRAAGAVAASRVADRLRCLAAFGTEALAIEATVDPRSPATLRAGRAALIAADGRRDAVHFGDARFRVGGDPRPLSDCTETELSTAFLRGGSARIVRSRQGEGPPGILLRIEREIARRAATWPALLLALLVASSAIRDGLAVAQGLRRVRFLLPAVVLASFGPRLWVAVSCGGAS